MNRYSRTSTSAGQSFNELTPDLKEWVRENAHVQGISEQKFIDNCIKHYGSVKQGKIHTEIALVSREKEEAKCWEKLKNNPLPTPIMLGAKPSAGERVIIVSLADNISTRIWGDKTAPYHLFSFDFVDDAGRYMRTPPGIKIYTEAAGITPGGIEVNSIEKSLELSDVGGSLRGTTDKTMPFDSNWETYLIPDGTRLRITHTGHVDSLLDIPNRQSGGHVLQIQPYW